MGGKRKGFFPLQDQRKRVTEALEWACYDRHGDVMSETCPGRRYLTATRHPIHMGAAYILTDGMYCKVGATTKGLWQRISGGRTMNPYALWALAVMPNDPGGDSGTVETIIHQRYQGKRLRGEWFDLSVSDVQRLCDEYRGVCCGVVLEIFTGIRHHQIWTPAQRDAIAQAVLSGAAF